MLKYNLPHPKQAANHRLKLINMNETLRLELSKWYETRDGRSTQIIHHNGTDVWEWEGIIDGRVEQWRCDGRYYGAHRDCPADLVKEIEPPKTINHD